MRISKIHFILLLAILLAGCAPAAAAETPTPLPTASQTAAPTSTPTATLTPVPPTATNTPSPTLSPTITMTPLPFNACPAIDEDYQYPFPETVDSTQELTRHILEALNNGITLSNLKDGVAQVVNENLCCWEDQIEDEYGRPQPYQLADTFTTRDLTGDNVKEIVFIGRTEFIPMMRIVDVFSCTHGNYIISLSHRFHYIENLEFLDLNNNNIPEIIIHMNADPMRGPYLVSIYEWDVEEFRSLIAPHEGWQENDFPDALAIYEKAHIEDYILKNDGTYEILLRGYYWWFGLYDASFGPYRAFFVTLTWDKTHFHMSNLEPEPPEYRFQAVQDGDWETWRGNFEKAMTFYDQALNDPSLKSLKNWQCEPQWVTYGGEEPSPPCPPDPNEQAVLKAYLHYRYMLIYTAKGEETLAQSEYHALTQLSTSHPAYPLKGLAAAFWNEYQTSKNLVAACDNARNYESDNHADFRNSIGNSWYVWQGGPTERLTCPFEGDLDELVDWD